MADLALLAQRGQGFHRSIVGDRRIGNVELENIDAIQTQTLQAALDRFGQVLRAGIVQPCSGPCAPTRLSLR